MPVDSMSEGVPSPAEITQILHEWRDGSREALDRLIPLSDMTS